VEPEVGFGNPLFFRLTIKNTGLKDIPEKLDFAVVLSPDTTFSTTWNEIESSNDYLLGTIEMDALSYGEEVIVSKAYSYFWWDGYPDNMVIDTSQNYYLGILLPEAQIDVNVSEMCDLGATWNQSDFITEVDFNLPDLIADKFVGPTTVESGTFSPIQVAMRNDSASEVRDLYVAVCAHTTSTFEFDQYETYEELGGLYIPSMNAYQTINIDTELYIDDDASGTVYVTAVIDPEQSTLEETNSNNYITLEVEVVTDPGEAPPTCNPITINTWEYAMLTDGDMGDCFYFDITTTGDYQVYLYPNSQGKSYSAAALGPAPTYTTLQSITDSVGPRIVDYNASSADTYHVQMAQDTQSELGFMYTVRPKLTYGTETEPNDTIQTANTFTISSDLQVISGTLGFGEIGQKDVYKFNSGSNKSILFVAEWCDSTGGPLMPADNLLDFSILNDQGKIIQRITSGFSCSEMVWFNATENTDYYIVLENPRLLSGNYHLHAVIPE